MIQQSRAKERHISEILLHRMKILRFHLSTNQKVVKWY